MAAGLPATMSAGKALLYRPPLRKQRRTALVRRPSIRGQLAWLRPACMFAIKLAGSALAGAAVTMLLSREDWKRVELLPPQDAPAYRIHQESTVYPSPPGRDLRSARGWQAEATDSSSDRGLPSNYPRRVKTVAFTLPPQEVITAIPKAAALAPPVTMPPALVAPSPSIGPPLVRNWHYQLQNINPAQIANSSHDLAVIDYSGEEGPFSPAQVERMKRKPDGSHRIVLSYMSIGEAENYRWYWSQRSSSWLGSENRRWRGNYAVKFWDPAWQSIILNYVDRVLAAGFDGVYLDKVDEFETMGHRDAMIEFVARISARAKAQRPDFMVISQNGDQLLTDAKFRRAIDGFAREDLFYGEDSEGRRNDSSSIRESVQRLKLLTAEGKPVFVVEYLGGERAQTARREIAEQGFIGLLAKRSLDAM
jgi:cysteinyl-tRNA synthetase